MTDSDSDQDAQAAAAAPAAASDGEAAEDEEDAKQGANDENDGSSNKEGGDGEGDDEGDERMQDEDKDDKEDKNAGSDSRKPKDGEGKEEGGGDEGGEDEAEGKPAEGAGQQAEDEDDIKRRGTVVWAKTGSFAWWPAVTVSGARVFGKDQADEFFESGLFCVSYFASAKRAGGTDLCDKVPRSRILPFLAHAAEKSKLPKAQAKKAGNRRFPEAVRLAREYLKNPPKLPNEDDGGKKRKRSEGDDDSGKAKPKKAKKAKKEPSSPENGEEDGAKKQKKQRKGPDGDKKDRKQSKDKKDKKAKKGKAEKEEKKEKVQFKEDDEDDPESEKGGQSDSSFSDEPAKPKAKKLSKRKVVGNVDDSDSESEGRPVKQRKLTKAPPKAEPKPKPKPAKAPKPPKQDSKKVLVEVTEVLGDPDADDAAVAAALSRLHDLKVTVQALLETGAGILVAKAAKNQAFTKATRDSARQIKQRWKTMVQEQSDAPQQAAGEDPLRAKCRANIEKSLGCVDGDSCRVLWVECGPCTTTPTLMEFVVSSNKVKPLAKCEAVEVSLIGLVREASAAEHVSAALKTFIDTLMKHAAQKLVAHKSLFSRTLVVFAIDASWHELPLKLGSDDAASQLAEYLHAHVPVIRALTTAVVMDNLAVRQGSFRMAQRETRCSCCVSLILSSALPALSQKDEDAADNGDNEDKGDDGADGAGKDDGAKEDPEGRDDNDGGNQEGSEGRGGERIEGNADGGGDEKERAKAEEEKADAKAEEEKAEGEDGGQPKSEEAKASQEGKADEAPKQAPKEKEEEEGEQKEKENADQAVPSDAEVQVVLNNGNLAHTIALGKVDSCRQALVECLSSVKPGTTIALSTHFTPLMQHCQFSGVKTLGSHKLQRKVLDKLEALHARVDVGVLQGVLDYALAHDGVSVAFLHSAAPSPIKGQLQRVVEQHVGRVQQLVQQMEHTVFKKEDGTTNPYKDKIRSLAFNLGPRGNHDLRRRLLEGSLDPKDVANMSAEDMAAKELQEWRKRVKQQETDKSIDATTHSASLQTTTQFRCGKCKERKCTYFEMQTRSADEPMTVFITCQNCGNNWKQ